MGIPDQDYFKYKSFVFNMWLIGMIIAIAGVSYYTTMYYVFSTFILSFYLFIILTMAIGCIINYFRFSKIMQ